MYQQLSSLNARVSNLIKVGAIVDVDFATAKARVDIGNAFTAFLPWLELSSHGLSKWSPPSIDEQVIVLSPSGESNQGMILRGLYHNKFFAPSHNPNEHVLKFSDGTRIAHNTASKQTTINSRGNVDIEAAQSVKIKAANDINIDSANVTISASNITLDCPKTSITGNVIVSGDIIKKT